MGAENYLKLLETLRLDLLEVFGKGYVIEHCIVELKKESQKNAFNNYLCDGIRNINEILATRFGGSYITEKFSSTIRKKKNNKKLEMTADEIKESLKNKINSFNHNDRKEE